MNYLLKILVPIICLASPLSYSQTDWQWQKPYPQGNALKSISFVATVATDGGFTWNHQFSDVATNYLVSAYFTDRENGWIVGEGGTILHTTDGGGPVTNVKDEEINKPQTFLLSQNYPNPFNPTTTIKWQIPKASLVTIKIYDVLGREKETVIDEYQEAGQYSILYIVNSTLSSGVYFYQLKVGNYIQTKKMILLK